MLEGQKSLEDHEKFRELNALAISGTLTPLEWSELNSHLDHCEECREVALQYHILATEGIPTIADAYTDRLAQGSWDEEATLKKLLARVRTAWRPVLDWNVPVGTAAPPPILRRIIANSLAQAALAACIVVAVGFQAYRLGVRAQGAASPASVSPDERLQKLAAEKKSADELLTAQSARLAQLHETSHQRDTLNTQIQDANQAYQNVRTELASLRADRERVLTRTTSLEARIDELTAINRDQERRLQDAEQYLASDRDIRELMGARKLYIADVFDVDSGS